MTSLSSSSSSTTTTPAGIIPSAASFGGGGGSPNTTTTKTTTAKQQHRGGGVGAGDNNNNNNNNDQSTRTSTTTASSSSSRRKGSSSSSSLKSSPSSTSLMIPILMVAMIVISISQLFIYDPTHMTHPPDTSSSSSSSYLLLFPPNDHDNNNDNNNNKNSEQNTTTTKSTTTRGDGDDVQPQTAKGGEYENSNGMGSSGSRRVSAMHNLLHGDEWKLSEHHRKKQQRQREEEEIAKKKKKKKEAAEGSSRGANEEGRHPILSILEDAGLLDRDNSEIASSSLPSWDDMTTLYGPLKEPIIMGLDTCEKYRTMVPIQERYVAVAGMFNTGTNAMTFHLEKNIYDPTMKHRWQVPWGKHRNPMVRLNHTAPGMMNVKQEYAMPIIVIRDPYHWMQSMCKQPYAAHWKHTRTPGGHCPNLIPTKHDRATLSTDETMIQDTFVVKVIFDKNQIMYWNSLVDLWSDWYQQYFMADYPHIMVRFEDMLFMAPTIMKEITKCITGISSNEQLPYHKFQYQTSSSKAHGSHTDFLKAITKTGNITARINGLTNDDLEYAAKHLDPELIQTFQYMIPEPNPTTTTTTKTERRS